MLIVVVVVVTALEMFASGLVVRTWLGMSDSREGERKLGALSWQQSLSYVVVGYQYLQITFCILAAFMSLPHLDLV